MRITTALPLLLLSAVAAIGCTPAESTGESGDDNAPPLEPFALTYYEQLRGSHLASGPDGDIFLGGTFDSTLNFGGGDLVAPAPGALYFAHLDASGGHLSSGSTGAYDRVGDVQVGPEGACFASGSFEGSANFGGGKLVANHAGFVVRFNEDGTTGFARSFPNSYQTQIDSIAALPDGGVVLAARTDDTVDFGMNDVEGTFGQVSTVVAAYGKDGLLKWQIRMNAHIIGGPQVAADEDGNIFVVGSTYESFDIGQTTIPGYSLFVTKMSPDGAVLWTQSSTKESDDFFNPPGVRDISVDDEGSVYLTGDYYYYPFSIAGVKSSPTQTYSAFLIKIDGTGKGVYARDFPVDGGYLLASVAGAKGGEVLLGLTTLFAVDFGGGGVGTNNNMTGYLARFDAKGNHMKSVALGNDRDDYLDALAADRDGNPVLLGRFEYTIDLNGETLHDSGVAASYLARIKF